MVEERFDMKISENLECDVLVIGGGGAGLAAAIEAAENGARVILIEKLPGVGGTTGLSVGSISASGTALQLQQGITNDRPEIHAEDLEKLGAGLEAADNPDLRTLLTENVPQTVAWLTRLGVEFIGPFPENGQRFPRMHNVLPTSGSYIVWLQRRARKLGVDIRCGITAKRLIMHGDRVVGVEFMDHIGRDCYLKSHALVLATGDFSANTAMVSSYISPQVAKVSAVNPASTGDGHRMALEVGARILNSQLAHISMRFSPPPHPSIALLMPPSPRLMRLLRWGVSNLPSFVVRPLMMRFLTSVLQPSPGIYQAGAILVNRDGRRFGDEAQDLTINLPDQPAGSAYILFDSRIAERFSAWPNYLSTAPGVAYAYLPDYRRYRGDLHHVASSLPELAQLIGMPLQNLVDTVEHYNASEARGERFSMSAPPFFALGPVNAVMTFTDGGLAVDEQLRVLGVGNQPIQGLFAAGSVGQGGLLLEGHGHHLGWAFTSGRRAGLNAALSLGANRSVDTP